MSWTSLAFRVSVEPGSWGALVALVFFFYAAWAYLRLRRCARSAAHDGADSFARWLETAGGLVCDGHAHELRWRPHFMMDAFFAVFGIGMLPVLVFEHRHVGMGSLFALISACAIAALRMTYTRVRITSAGGRPVLTIHDRLLGIMRREVRLRGPLPFSARVRPDVEGHRQIFLVATSAEFGQKYVLPRGALLFWNPPLDEVTANRYVELLDGLMESGGQPQASGPAQ